MTPCQVSTSGPLVKYLAPIFSYLEPCILFTSFCILCDMWFFCIFACFCHSITFFTCVLNNVTIFI